MSPDRDDAETRAQALPGEPPVTGSDTKVGGAAVAGGDYGVARHPGYPAGGGEAGDQVRTGTEPGGYGPGAQGANGSGEDAPTAVAPPSGDRTGTGGTGGTGGTAGRTRRSRRADGGAPAKKRGSFARELPFLIVVAFVLALLIKAFLVQAFWIPSGSMEKTLLVNDRVLVNKIVYRFRDAHRGEIVVFNGDNTGFQKVETPIAPPSNGFTRVLRDVQGFLGLGAPSDKDFIKRVIAVGGDTVACCDAQGRVSVNGRALNEPYVYDPSGTGATPFSKKVPKGELWVMGDHRDGSLDSRANGPIPQKNVVGRAFVRVWPVTRFGFLTVPSTFHGIPKALGADPSLLGGVALTVPIGLVRRRRRRRLSLDELPDLLPRPSLSQRLAGRVRRAGPIRPSAVRRPPRRSSGPARRRP